MTSSGGDVGVCSGSVETTIADSDADQTVMSGAVGAVRRRVYSPGITTPTITVAVSSSMIMILSAGLGLKGHPERVVAWR